MDQQSINWFVPQCHANNGRHCGHALEPAAPYRDQIHVCCHCGAQGRLSHGQFVPVTAYPVGG